MFIVHALLAAMLVLGYCTRLAVVGCLVMSWSLMARNTMLTSSGDGLLIWMLIWSIFLPLGAAGSVDAKIRGPGPRSVCSFASAAMLLQIVFLYLGAFISKRLPEWRSDFTAVYYFLASHLGTPLGRQVARFPFICVLLTMSTMALELIGPFVALTTASVPWLRMSIVAIFMFFHLCLGATLYVGPFAYICIVAWLPYVPAASWDWLLARKPVRAIAAGWDRTISLIASVVPRWPAPSGEAIGFSRRLAGAAVAVLFGFVFLVNVKADLPESIQRHLGPILRLPQLKQTWGVMHMPPHMATRMVLRARLVDGSQRTLITSDAPMPSDFVSYLWPPRDARVQKYRQETMMLTSSGVPGCVDAMCSFFQRRWDAQHPPTEHIEVMEVFCAFIDIPPIEAAGMYEPRGGESMIHRWSVHSAATQP
jgi:hypothetical protein